MKPTDKIRKWLEENGENQHGLGNSAKKDSGLFSRVLNGKANARIELMFPVAKAMG